MRTAKWRAWRAVLLCLALVGCNLPWSEVFLHPTVEQRVRESLALPEVIPPPVNPDSFRFAMFGDPHIGKDTFHRLERFREEIEARGIDFVCILGDLTENGLATEIAEARAALERLAVPVYVAPGNHDLWSPGGWDRFKQAFGPGSKAFTAGPVRIILFDTACGTIGSTQFRWLAQELAGPEAIKVLGTHYPLFPGEFPGVSQLASEAERYRFAALLRDTGAWGVVSGHIHRFDIREVAGVRYITAGTMRQRPSDGRPGYLLCTFARGRLTFEFVGLD